MLRRKRIRWIILFQNSIGLITFLTTQKLLNILPTDFEWDTIYVFRSYVDGESINATVGEDVVRSSYQHSSDTENVLIFVLEGSLAHAAEVRRVGIGPGSDRHFVEGSSGAWLVPSDPDRRASPLRLVERPPDG
jgi:hypothetical protein